MDIYLALKIIYIAFLHFLGDFVLQSDAMAKSKSKHFDLLFAHTLTYSTVFAFGLIPVLGLNNAAGFFCITLFIHTATDFVTSRINAKYFGIEWHKFFLCVGFDQFLHFAQLVLTFYLLTQSY